jgi:hypothetical protein
MSTGCSYCGVDAGDSDYIRECQVSNCPLRDSRPSTLRVESPPSAPTQAPAKMILQDQSFQPMENRPEPQSQESGVMKLWLRIDNLVVAPIRKLAEKSRTGSETLVGRIEMCTPLDRERPRDFPIFFAISGVGAILTLLSGLLSPNLSCYSTLACLLPIVLIAGMFGLRRGVTRELNLVIESDKREQSQLIMYGDKIEAKLIPGQHVRFFGHRQRDGFFRVYYAEVFGAVIAPNVRPVRVEGIRSLPVTVPIAIWAIAVALFVLLIARMAVSGLFS